MNWKRKYFFMYYSSEIIFKVSNFLCNCASNDFQLHLKKGRSSTSAHGLYWPLRHKAQRRSWGPKQQIWGRHLWSPSPQQVCAVTHTLQGQRRQGHANQCDDPTNTWGHVGWERAGKSHSVVGKDQWSWTHKTDFISTTFFFKCYNVYCFPFPFQKSLLKWLFS